MKRWPSIISLLLWTIIAIGQENNVTVSNRYAFGFGQMTLADPGLSNQQYKGLAYSLEGRHGAFYPKQKGKVSWTISDRWRYASTMNVSHSSLISYYGANVGFGTNYHWSPCKSLQVTAGGVAEIYGGIKNNLRNVNNIATGDIQITLFASTGVHYGWQWKSAALNLDYTISTPLTGTMFVPEMGQSYYEIWLALPRGLNEIVHFTSPHNRQGIRGAFTANMIFNRFTLFLGLRHEHDWWQANRQNIFLKTIEGQIGTVIDLNLRCGRESQPRNNVIF